MHTVPTARDSSGTTVTWGERLFVFAGIGVAAAVTAISPALGAGLEPVGLVWFVAIVWTVLANLAHVLWRGFRLGDWSAFRRYDPPDNSELIDWSTQTGEYAYVRIAEEHDRLMREDYA